MGDKISFAFYRVAVTPRVSPAKEHSWTNTQSISSLQLYFTCPCPCASAGRLAGGISWGEADPQAMLAAWLPVPGSCLLWPVFGALGARFPSEK